MGRGQTAVRRAMLERDDELAQLEAALAGARSGHGSVILICGDAGIGKTTLVRALAESAAPTDVYVRWGRTWEDGGAPAYWPWTQVLRAQIGDTDTATLEKQLGAGALDIVQLVPELAGRLGITETRAPTQDAHGARFRLCEAVGTFLGAASAEAPILVILEDLHAADETSLSLLQFVTRQVDDAHLLIVGTYRQAEAATSPMHSRLLTGIAREATLQVLGGIGPSSVRQLLERTAGFVPQEALAHEVHETTEGNPFFVGEIARLLGSRLATGRGRLPLPEAVQAVIRRRLEKVDKHVRRMLVAAAVIGREFDLPMMGAMTGEDTDHLLDTLGAAARLRIVEEVGLNRWSFVHALMRETLYEEIGLAERVGWHKTAAEAFELLRPDALTEIAHHRYEAARRGDDPGSAVAACEAAGHQAASVLAYERAVHWYERALEVLEHAPNEARRRYDLLIALGDAQLRGGSRPEGRATYRCAAEAARQLGDPELFGQAALGCFGIGEDDIEDHSRTNLIAEALEMLPDEDSALRAKLLLYREGWTGRGSNDSINEAVAMARRVADRPTLATVLWNWHYAYQAQSGQLEPRLEAADELVGLATGIGDKEQLVLALQWRLADRFEGSDLGGMHEDLRAAIKAAESLRLPFLSWGVTFPRATVAHLYGRLDEAEALANEAVAFGRQCGFPVAEWMFTSHRLALAWSRGRFTEMAELARQAGDQMPPNSDHCSILTAVALAELGRRSEANSLLDQVLAAGPWAARSTCRMPPEAAVLAQACWLLGRRDPIPSVLEVLEPFAGSHVVAQVMMGSLGACDRYLGQLATLEERFDEADAYFEATHRLHERLGAQVWLPHGWMDHARTLLLRGGPGDEDRAIHLLDKAESCFLDLGAPGYAERCRTLRPPRNRTVFRLDGGEWTIRYSGTDARLRDSKGLQYLAVLLSRPGQQVHALELTGERPALADGRIESRLRNLQAEIDDAQADHDLGRLERAEDEFDDLVARLQASAETPAGERARQSVTRAVKGTIDRIASCHRVLGEHLQTTVRTGVYSSYTPDARSPIEWET